ncbi:hypothetical protein [Moorena sp. SIO4G3]|uniref:hypothetical protein n=1 Tax=Moorena sp. SIO4G3 TaxID=2607821 RepID=UPI0025E25952|nr:hypothetical protein [Moorena sp. SIO4G3]
MTSPMGADVQKSEILSVPVLSRLWFLLAVATLVRYSRLGLRLSKQVFVDGQILTGARGNSYFR